MGNHLIDGEFQSDKYPTTPRGKVPLSCTDKLAQPLLWQYAQLHRSIDAEFSDDLEQALINAGFDPPPKDAPPHFDFTEDGVMFALPTWERSDVATSLRLQMCSVDVPTETVATWTDDQVKAADCWACSVSLIASDNDDIKAPPKPAFLPPETPWRPTNAGTIM